MALYTTFAFRSLWILLGCAALALFAVLVGNTVRFRSRQLVLTPIARPGQIALDPQAAATRLAEVLALPTVSSRVPEHIDHQPFLKLHEYVQSSFPNVHSVLRCEVIGELSLFYTWKGAASNKPPILLMSHIDVVPIDPKSRELWEYPPETPCVAEGHIWGRGALDVKCGAMGMLEAVEYLISNGFQPDRTIYLALGHDEECGGLYGNAKIAAKLRSQGVRLATVFDEGGGILDQVIPGVDVPVAFVAVAEKGLASFQLSASGDGGHASLDSGVNAAEKLAAAICQLEKHPMPARLDSGVSLLLDYVGPEMPFLQRTVVANRWLFAPLIRRQLAANQTTSSLVRTTLSVTRLKSGVADNVVSPTASALLQARLLPGDQPEDVKRHIEKTILELGVRCEPGPREKTASKVSRVDSREFHILQKTIQELFPEAIVAPAMTPMTTDSCHYADIADNTYRFIPMRMAHNDLKRLHGINERIAVENYIEIIRFYVRLLQNLTAA